MFILWLLEFFIIILMLVLRMGEFFFMIEENIIIGVDGEKLNILVKVYVVVVKIFWEGFLG